MRSLGDMRWLNDYIGIPYLAGGRDRAGCDCYGLLKLVYLEKLGIMLPDWATDQIDIDIKIRDDMIASVVTSGDFIEVEEPTDGCFVVCYRTRAAHHLGLYFGGGVLHSHTAAGSIYEPLSQFQQEYPKTVFGEWTP